MDQERREFEGKVAVVTGATSGIGRATAVLFAQRGAFVTAVGRSQEALTTLQEELGHQVLPVQADITLEAELQAIVDKTMARFGRIDVLVNSAGILAPGTIETTSISSWDDVLNVNLTSIFKLTQRVVPHLLATKGNVVNVSSVNGQRAFAGVLAYCVSKAGLDQFTRCAALELASRGVRVNAVNPAVVVTDIHRRSGMDEAAYAAFLERSATLTHPLGRVGQAHEVAELIAYLASDRAAWITGVTYGIDGGRGILGAR